MQTCTRAKRAGKKQNNLGKEAQVECRHLLARGAHEKRARRGDVLLRDGTRKPGTAPFGVRARVTLPAVTGGSQGTRTGGFFVT